MRSLSTAPWTVEQFLDWERREPERYEFVDGVVKAMVGGSLRDAEIKGNLFALLRQQLKGKPCRVFVDGPKVVAGNNVTYPDVIVTCASLTDLSADIVPEPAFIAEILSPSTEGWDRGGKWRAYQTVPSLLAYLLVSQDEPRAELYTRNGDSWRFAVLTDAAGALVLPPADARLTLAELYAGTGLANG